MSRLQIDLCCGWYFTSFPSRLIDSWEKKWKAYETEVKIQESNWTEHIQHWTQEFCILFFYRSLPTLQNEHMMWSSALFCLWKWAYLTDFRENLFWVSTQIFIINSFRIMPSSRLWRLCSLIDHYQLSKEFDTSLLIIFRSLTFRSALWSMSVPWVGLLSGFHTCYSGGEQGNFCSCQLQNRGRSDP